MLTPDDLETCRDADCGFFRNASDGGASLDTPAATCRVIHELSLLFEISQTLEESLNLQAVLRPALKKMANSMGLRSGTVTILNRDTSALSVDIAYDVSVEESADACSHAGADLIKWVVETGKQVSVQNIAGDPRFEDGASSPTGLATKEVPISFLCVQIRSGQRMLGALSVERLSAPGDNLDHDMRMLTIISSVIAQAVSLRQSAQERIASLRDENDRLQEQIRNHFKPSNMIGSSGVMQTVYSHIEQVGSSKTTVLIRGESGVGKELVAHALHKGSPRSARAFVKVNCAALPESIVESELFGHEKGAFTGAIAMRKGRFELADSGTIFLDEIGDLTMATQVKLLRILQEREFERVGGQNTLRCDVRVIAATSRDLEQLIEEGKFRLDLYYRLNVFPIYVPPLRERKADMLQLADYFVEKCSKENGKKINRISTAAIDLMMRYHWPGNVRELGNCIERAVLLCRGDAIQAHHLPPTLQASDQGHAPVTSTLESAVAALEHELIVDSLKATGGNMAKAARQLGISERIMGLRVKKYEVDIERFRS
jgi:Nif-specific regulatory protein